MTTAKDPELVELPGDADLDAELRRRLADLYETWSSPPPDLVGQKPAGGGFQADYLGHAETTRALLEADPYWTLEPAHIDAATGGPTVTHTKDGRLVSWWRLQVCGHERLCVGTCPDNAQEPEKQLIGDALRNGAMRFGVALALWSRQEWVDTTTGRPPAATDGRHGQLVAELQNRVRDLDDDTREAFRTVIAGAGLPDRGSAMTVAQLEQAAELLTELTDTGQEAHE